MKAFWKRLERWERSWCWLALLLITVGNVVRGTDSWWIAILAFVAGAAFEERFPRKPRRPKSSEAIAGFPPMAGPLEPRSRNVPPYPDKGVEP